MERLTDRLAHALVAVSGLFVFGFPALICGMIVWDGYVLMKLWAWFVSAQFGVAPLRLPIAAGLSLVAQFLLTGAVWRSDFKAGAGIVDGTVQQIIRSAFFLAIGAAIHFIF